MISAGGVDEGTVGQRLAMLAAAFVLAAIAAASAPGAARPLPDWAAPQIATVVAHGLMGAKSVSTFKPNKAVTRQMLANLAAGLQQELAPTPPTGSSTTTGTTTTTMGGTTTAPPVSNPTAPVTMAQLDRSLVQALGLG